MSSPGVRTINNYASDGHISISVPYIPAPILFINKSLNIRSPN